jgi:hypothetical protein
MAKPGPSIPMNSDELFLMLMLRDITPIFQREGYTIGRLVANPIRDDAIEFEFKPQDQMAPRIIIAKERVSIVGNDLLRCSFIIPRPKFIGYVDEHLSYEDLCEIHDIPRLEERSLAPDTLASTLWALRNHLNRYLPKVL